MPEEGVNYEVGIRGHVFKDFRFDVVAYDFEMTNIIVSESSGQSYINTGSSQKGLEVTLSWQKNFPSQNLSRLRIWSSSTFTDYKFAHYNYNNNDFSGKRLPSSAPKILVGGLDLDFLKKFYLNVTTNYVDKIAVNDGTTVQASDYCLVSSRVGYKSNMGGEKMLEIFAGVDNALDQKYSLGNDINALGARYFNAAATRNFYFGLKIR